MKYIQILIPALILWSCGSKTTNENTSENTSDKETEVSLNEDLIQSIQGEYVSVQTEGEKITVPEPCSFDSYQMKIGEITEYSGEWYIDYMDESYSVVSLSKSEGDISIEATSDDMEYTFLLEKSDGGVINAAMVGDGFSLSLIPKADKANYETVPCMDMASILDNLPSSWYLLSSFEDEWVIMEPCEEAPGGFSMEDGYFDNWSGSDPYEIVEIMKENDRIEVEYNSSMGTRKIILHDFSGTTMQAGEGSEDDPIYVSEEAKDQYDTIVEEC